MQKGIDKLIEEVNGMKLDNELKERTIDNKVKESSLTLQNLMAEIFSKEANKKLMKSKQRLFQQKSYKDGKNLLKKEKRSLTKDIVTGKQIGRASCRERV